MIPSRSSSRRRAIFCICYHQFFTQIERARFGDGPIFTVDGAHYYNDAFRWWLRLKHILSMEQNLKKSWKDSFSKLRVNVKVLADIDLVKK
jgi:hypothetical protein